MVEKDVFAGIQYFIIDMDGTFYLGDNIIDGSKEFIKQLRDKGKDFFFFTNNSSHNAEECLLKRSHGIRPYLRQMHASTTALLYDTL